jgi:hypothetical protein
MDITERTKELVSLLGGKIDEAMFAYLLQKALQIAADFCNLSGAEYFPKDAEFWLTEYTMDNAKFTKLFPNRAKFLLGVIT